MDIKELNLNDTAEQMKQAVEDMEQNEEEIIYRQQPKPEIRNRRVQLVFTDSLYKRMLKKLHRKQERTKGLKKYSINQYIIDLIEKDLKEN